jgi:regulator of replication initiation timing
MINEIVCLLNIHMQLFLFYRLQSIEKEYEQLKHENPKLRLEVDKLRVVSDYLA